MPPVDFPPVVFHQHTQKQLWYFSCRTWLSPQIIQQKINNSLIISYQSKAQGWKCIYKIRSIVM